jgi:hypothetical protein
MNLKNSFRQLVKKKLDELPQTPSLKGKKVSVATVLKAAKTKDENCLRGCVIIFKANLPENILNSILENQLTDETAILEFLVKNHKQGEAAFLLGIDPIYNGKDDNDRMRGSQCILEAAKLNFPVPTEPLGLAHFNLGKMLITNASLAKRKQGAQHIIEAAKLKHVPALFEAARILDEGSLAVTNAVDAAKWYLLAKTYALNNDDKQSIQYQIDGIITRYGQENFGKGMIEAQKQDAIWNCRAEVP